jgi:hypothetical protein
MAIDPSADSYAFVWCPSYYFDHGDSLKETLIYYVLWAISGEGAGSTVDRRHISYTHLGLFEP